MSATALFGTLDSDSTAARERQQVLAFLDELLSRAVENWRKLPDLHCAPIAATASRLMQLQRELGIPEKAIGGEVPRMRNLGCCEARAWEKLVDEIKQLRIAAAQAQCSTHSDKSAKWWIDVVVDALTAYSRAFDAVVELRCDAIASELTRRMQAVVKASTPQPSDEVNTVRQVVGRLVYMLDAAPKTYRYQRDNHREQALARLLFATTPPLEALVDAVSEHLLDEGVHSVEPLITDGNSDLQDTVAPLNLSYSSTGALRVAEGGPLAENWSVPYGGAQDERSDTLEPPIYRCLAIVFVVAVVSLIICNPIADLHAPARPLLPEPPVPHARSNILKLICDSNGWGTTWFGCG